MTQKEKNEIVERIYQLELEYAQDQTHKETRRMREISAEIAHIMKRILKEEKDGIDIVLELDEMIQNKLLSNK